MTLNHNITDVPHALHVLVAEWERRLRQHQLPRVRQLTQLPLEILADHRRRTVHFNSPHQIFCNHSDHLLSLTSLLHPHRQRMETSLDLHVRQRTLLRRQQSRQILRHLAEHRQQQRIHRRLPQRANAYVPPFSFPHSTPLRRPTAASSSGCEGPCSASRRSVAASSGTGCRVYESPFLHSCTSDSRPRGWSPTGRAGASGPPRASYSASSRHSKKECMEGAGEAV